MGTLISFSCQLRHQVGLWGILLSNLLCPWFYFCFCFLVVENIYVVLLLCISFVPRLFSFVISLIYWLLCLTTKHHPIVYLMKDHLFSYSLQPLVHIIQLVYKLHITVVPGPVVVFYMVYHYTKRVTLTRLLGNMGPAIYIVLFEQVFCCYKKVTTKWEQKV